MATVQNPSRIINVGELRYFESKLASKYATKQEATVIQATKETCESIVDELT